MFERPKAARFLENLCKVLMLLMRYNSSFHMLQSLFKDAVLEFQMLFVRF